MNAKRRKKLKEVINTIESALGSLEDMAADEQEAYSNLPEPIQCSERGEQMEINISYLEDASIILGDVIETLGEVD